MKRTKSKTDSKTHMDRIMLLAESIHGILLC